MKRRLFLLGLLYLVGGCAADRRRFGTFIVDRNGLFEQMAVDATDKLTQELPVAQYALRVVQPGQQGFGRVLTVATRGAGYRVYAARSADAGKGAQEAVDVAYAVDYLGATGDVRLWIEVGAVRLGRVYRTAPQGVIVAGPWSRAEVAR